MIDVKETVFDQPDISELTPLPVVNGRSADHNVVFINRYGRYQTVVAYWNDIDKVFRESGTGRVITEEIVRTEEL